MTAPVFVSYRRDDAAAEAGAIVRAVRDQMGDDAVFKDTLSIPAGADWPDVLRRELEGATLAIVVIGPGWVRSCDEWGRRRIDLLDDWVRQEVEAALQRGIPVIPVFVDGARPLPVEALPEPLQPLHGKQGVELRRDYWDHDILLLLAQLDAARPKRRPATSQDTDPYPKSPAEAPDAMEKDKLERILANELTGWKLSASVLPGHEGEVRMELSRAYEFRSFQEAVGFMAQVAPGCDIAMHHPRWENIWRTVSVFLSTWDEGLHRVTDRDVVLARYFDRVFDEYRGAAGGG